MKNINDDETVLSARMDPACYGAAQARTFELAAHHRLMEDKLEAVERGENTPLMIFMTPGGGKSFLGPKFFQRFILADDSDKRSAT